ncbi:MAG: DinB family protein [Candidatus Hodarchaeota archaeon]
MKKNNIIQLMIWELERGFQGLFQILIDIKKDEAQWKPSPRSRTLDTIKHWNEKGNNWVSTQNLDPLSTIEYKIVHLAQCKEMYDEYAFREGILNWSELQSPEWPRCIDYLKQTQLKLVNSLQQLTDNQLEEMIPTNWNDLWPTKQIISTLIHHDAYHLGQICTLRNLYRIQNNR